MDIPKILINITGFILLIWTIRSIYIHIKERKQQKSDSRAEEQSVSEQILNNILLYLWLAFMIVFSTGMILNN